MSISIPNNNNKINSIISSLKSAKVEATQNKVTEKLEISLDKSENVVLDNPKPNKKNIPTNEKGIKLFDKVDQKITNDTVVKDSKALKELVETSAKKSNGHLKRVILETAKYYPDKLSEVIETSAKNDYFQMKNTIKDIKNEATKNGIEIKNSFPTGAITRSLAIDSAKKIVKAGVIGIPLDMAFNIVSYDDGKLDAKQYAGKSLGGFVSWSTFEAGLLGSTAIASAVIGKNISPLARTVVGVGTGMIATSIYHKTIGHTIDDKIAEIIPNKIAKPIADNVNRFLGKPINNYIVKPIKNNPKTSMVIGGAVLTALTVKFPVKFGKNILLGLVGATAVGVGGNLAIDAIFGKSKSEISHKADNSETNNKIKLPDLNVKPTPKELKNALEIQEKYDKDPNSITDDEALIFQNVLERVDKMDQESLDSLVSEYQKLL